MSTSCSLQHVPYTLKHENKLSDEYLNYFAFAEEKLVELKELSRLAECGNIEEDERFKTNRQLFAGTRKCDNEAVKKDLRKLQRQITEDFLQEVRDSSFRRKNLHYRSCLQLQSVHFHRQRC